MSGHSVGLAYVGMGAGTVLASLLGGRISRRIGPGSCLTLGFAINASGWLMLSLAPPGPLGIAMFSLNLTCLGFGAVLLFVNFLALRQAVTPAPMLGRMTATMRWLVTFPNGPGALAGGLLGEYASLRTSLAFAGCCGLVLTLAAWRSPRLRAMKKLPVPEDIAGEMAMEVLRP
jgi:predicted MFS family arabinose efflux permease